MDYGFNAALSLIVKSDLPGDNGNSESGHKTGNQFDLIQVSHLSASGLKTS